MFQALSDTVDVVCAPVALAMLLLTSLWRICSEQATWSFLIVHALQKGIAQLHGLFGQNEWCFNVLLIKGLDILFFLLLLTLDVHLIYGYVLCLGLHSFLYTYSFVCVFHFIWHSELSGQKPVWVNKDQTIKLQRSYHAAVLFGFMFGLVWICLGASHWDTLSSWDVWVEIKSCIETYEVFDVLLSLFKFVD
jgi:hypothetical protein